MNVFIAASAILTLIALLFLFSTLRHLRHRHLLRAGPGVYDLLSLRGPRRASESERQGDRSSQHAA